MKQLILAGIVGGILALCGRMELAAMALLVVVFPAYVREIIKADTEKAQAKKVKASKVEVLDVAPKPVKRKEVLK